MDRVSSMLSFVKVAERGSFSSAARQLGLANSVITGHVKWLEKRLAVRLFNRTTRSVTLTEAGKAYYDRCVKIISEIEDAEVATQILQSKPGGVLRLNTSPGIPALIASSIARYNDLYPDVTVHLTATSRMLDLVSERYDLAIWYAADPPSNLIIRRLAYHRTVVCASPEYLAKHGTPMHPFELTKHNNVIFHDAPQGKEGKEWLFTGPDGDFQVRLSGTLETNSPIALRAAALNGQGFIIVPPPLVIDDLKAGTLVTVLDEFVPKPLSVDVLYPHREHLPAKVRAFIDVLAKNFRHKDWCREYGRSAPRDRLKTVEKTVEKTVDKAKALAEVTA